MNALNALKIRSHQRILARLLVALLFLAIGFSSAGSKIEPGLALPLHPSDLPEGYHDGGEGATNRGGCNASGWAVDPDDRARDLQVRILSDGSPVATVTAGDFREDVVGFCTDGTCGFSTSLWGLISKGEAHEITAQAYDEETATWVTLPGSPKTLTCWGYPEGNHDGNEGVTNRDGCSASGWAVDPDDRTRDLQVRILSDGSPVATVTASDFREDLVAICTDGTCGFSTSLWGLISKGEEHEITAQAYDEETASWIDVDEDPTLLTCWGYPEGNHDGSEGIVLMSACNASGWAFDPDDPARDLQVRILSDGSPVATVTASDFREDLVAICTGGTCGFSTSLWGLIDLDEEHEILAQAYDQETAGWIDVDEIPKLLTCQEFLDIWVPIIFKSNPGAP
jgi:predicted amidohydrolase